MNAPARTAGTCRMIVNADDFGLSPAVNRGIVRAHRAGLVSSTTMLVNTEFVDEASGEIFRVARVRRSGAGLEQAVLTLDREVFAEDLDIPAGDARCETCVSAAPVCENTNVDCEKKQQNLVVDPADVIRTVWVYPPPVSPTRPSAQTVTFDGPTPVVGIDVITLTLTP